jgi:hypothetical protein
MALTCPTCGYDVTGLPSSFNDGSKTCPECGGTFQRGRPASPRLTAPALVVGLALAAIPLVLCIIMAASEDDWYAQIAVFVLFAPVGGLIGCLLGALAVRRAAGLTGSQTLMLALGSLVSNAVLWIIGCVIVGSLFPGHGSC